MLKDFIADLSHPKRKKRAHLLLLAGAVSVLLIIWVSVHLLSSTQRSKTRTELEKLVEEIGAELQTAENRRIIGDVKAANDLLAHADGQVKQIMDNDSGLFRVEALDLLDRIRAAEEKINNIARLSPRVVANLAGKNADIVAQGLLGVAAGEFIVYDRQDLFRLVLNSVEDPVRLSEEELIIDATAFPRFQSSVFLTTGNSVVEVTGDQRIAMKTEDPKGWAKGVDMESYLRFLYVLSPDDKQIYKYEHLNGRYSTPVAYNVNGDLTGALDMAIDGSVYVLKDGGKVVKLFRGEDQPFEVRRGPEGVLQHATRMFKVTEGNFYFLDPEERRVIVIGDSGQTGEAPYIKQYVLEGEQVGNLKDLYVDDEESILYVLDEKRVYAIELSSQ